LNRHQRLLAEQNCELQRELDGFVETDEIVKRNLDRKDKVQQIRSQVDEVIKRSIIEVKSRSPIRGTTARTSAVTYHFHEQPASNTYTAGGHSHTLNNFDTI
jgi:hypothetical protein